MKIKNVGMGCVCQDAPWQEVVDRECGQGSVDNGDVAGGCGQGVWTSGTWAGDVGGGCTPLPVHTSYHVRILPEMTTDGVSTHPTGIHTY